MVFDGWFGKKEPDEMTTAAPDPATLAGDPGRVHSRFGGQEQFAAKPGGAKAPGDASDLPPIPDTSALNSQIVQAVQFTNAENARYAPEMIATPPEMMVSTANGMAVQDAKNYMNAIMQIAVAAQAVAIKKAAEGPEPVAALKEIPLLAEIQNMVTQAVGVYGSVSGSGGSDAKKP